MKALVVAFAACGVVAAGGLARAQEAPAAEAAPEWPRKDVAPLVRKALEDEAAVLCRNDAYPLTAAEAEWCPLVAEGHPACPAFAKACARGNRAELVDKKRRWSFSWDWLPKLPVSLRALMWIAFAAGAVALVWQLVRRSLGWRPPVDHAAPAPIEDAAAAEAQRLLRVVETDVQRLLARARAAAQDGDYAAAIADASAALLRRLDGAGVVRIEPHRTNGDYVGDLAARHAALAPRMADVVEEVERAQFGSEATAERFAWVWDRVLGLLAEPLAPGGAPGRALATMALVLVAMGAFTSSGCSRRPDWDGSPSGRGAVVALLRSYGFEVRERFSPLAKLATAEPDDEEDEEDDEDDADADESTSEAGRAIDQVILLPGAVLTDADAEALEAWVRGGGALTIAGVPPRVAGPAPGLPAWIPVEPAAPSGGTSSARKLKVAADFAKTAGALRVQVPGNAVLGATTLSPLLAGARAPYAAYGDYEDGRLLAFADDALFTNAALLVADDAKFLVEALRLGGRRIDLVGDLTGVVSSSPAESIKRGRLAPAMLQLFALLALAFVWRGARLGRAVDLPEDGRRAFAEHVTAVGAQLARARAGRHALVLYAAWTIERLRARLGGAGAGPVGLSTLAERVAQRSGRPLGDVMRILVEAREPAPGMTTAEALATGRALAQLAASNEDETETRKGNRGRNRSR